MTFTELREQVIIQGRLVISHYDEEKDKENILFESYDIESAGIHLDIADRKIIYMYPFYDGEINGIKIEV